MLELDGALEGKKGRGEGFNTYVRNSGGQVSSWVNKRNPSHGSTKECRTVQICKALIRPGRLIFQGLMPLQGKSAAAALEETMYPELVFYPHQGTSESHTLPVHAVTRRFQAIAFAEALSCCARTRVLASVGICWHPRCWEGAMREAHRQAARQADLVVAQTQGYGGVFLPVSERIPVYHCWLFHFYRSVGEKQGKGLDRQGGYVKSTSSVTLLAWHSLD